VVLSVRFRLYVRAFCLRVLFFGCLGGVVDVMCCNAIASLTVSTLLIV
jgi:hypothetical protein